MSLDFLSLFDQSQRPMPFKSLRLFKVLKWGLDSDSDEWHEDREETTSLDEANIVSSQFRGTDTHMVVLDLDIPAALVPSSTPGHSHLYIQTRMSWDAYENLLDALAIAGVLEPGYVGASKARKFTGVRLPWISKLWARCGRSRGVSVSHGSSCRSCSLSPISLSRCGGSSRAPPRYRRANRVRREAPPRVPSGSRDRASSLGSACLRACVARSPNHEGQPSLVQSLGMAAKNRGSTGEQLPTPFYPSFEREGVRFWRSQLCLVVGPGSAGKSLLISNLVAKWGRSCLAFLLDQDSATAAARFAATEMDRPFLDIKRDLDDPYTGEILAAMGFIQTDFKAETLEDIQLQIDAYLERYGVPPEVVVIDNIGNMTSGYDDEWKTLKALTLELDIMARKYEMFVVCAHHTTDKPTTEPLPRSDILGKISQYPRLILSVAYNGYSGEYKVAAVKNSSGPTDPTAANPLVFEANPANMQVTERASAFSPAADYLAAFKMRG